MFARKNAAGVAALYRGGAGDRVESLRISRRAEIKAGERGESLRISRRAEIKAGDCGESLRIK